MFSATKVPSHNGSIPGLSNIDSSLAQKINNLNAIDKKSQQKYGNQHPCNHNFSGGRGNIMLSLNGILGQNGRIACIPLSNARSITRR